MIIIKGPPVETDVARKHNIIITRIRGVQEWHISFNTSILTAS